MKYEERELHCGDSITQAIKMFCAEAKEKQISIRTEGNGVTILISRSTDPKLLIRDFHRAMNGEFEGKVIGPLPKAKLSAEEIERGEKIRAFHRQENEKARLRYAEEMRQKSAKLKDLLASAPAFEIVYGKEEEFYHTHESWASAINIGRLLQTNLPLSYDKLHDAIDQADVGGFSGFIVGVFVNFLTEFWKHGSELRQIWNAHYGVVNEKGTVNPAIVVAGA